MKDIKHHKESMGMRAWQREAAKRRGKYGDMLTIAQLRKDTRIPPSAMSDENLKKFTMTFVERWGHACPSAPLSILNEAAVLLAGALWEVCGAQRPTHELFAQILTYSGANWLINPYFEHDTTDNFTPPAKGDGQETHALH